MKTTPNSEGRRLSFTGHPLTCLKLTDFHIIFHWPANFFVISEIILDAQIQAPHTHAPGELLTVIPMAESGNLVCWDMAQGGLGIGL